MARRNASYRPLCASGPTRNTGTAPSKETATFSRGTTTTTAKDPMVASTTSRPSADPTTEQPLDLRQAAGHSLHENAGKVIKLVPQRLSLGWIGDATHEKDAAGAVIADEEE